MKKILYIVFFAMGVILTACRSDEPKDNKDKGFLIINLIQEDGAEDIDFSDYKILIMSEKGGFGWETPFKEISWPISRPSGEYIVIAESPLVSETETSRFYYTGMKRNVSIFKDKTTELTLTLRLEEIPKE